MRFILADELNCFPPAAVESELQRLGISYVQLLERIAQVLATRPDLLLREVTRCLPSYWPAYIRDQYPSAVQHELLATLRDPSQTNTLRQWEQLAPYVLKKATTLAVETLVYDRLPWVLNLLQNWTSFPSPAPDIIPSSASKEPILGAVLEGLRYLNKVQLLAVEAAQKEARSNGEVIAFGDMCVRKGFLTPAQLAEALEIQRSIAVSPDSPKRLGLYLLEVGVITPAQLCSALNAQNTTGLPLGQILVQEGSIEASLLETVLLLQRQDRISAYASSPPTPP
jgi:hypothetical protein